MTIGGCNTNNHWSRRIQGEVPATSRRRCRTTRDFNHHQTWQTRRETCSCGSRAKNVRSAEGECRRRTGYRFTCQRRLGIRQVSVVLLDTHAWVWLLNGDSKLNPKAVKAIERSLSEEAVLLSAISPWEVAMLVNNGRLTLHRDVGE